MEKKSSGKPGNNHVELLSTFNLYLSETVPGCLPMDVTWQLFGTTAHNNLLSSSTPNC
jgi:hypothetical protein